ncbi:uncharacterized protein LOC133515513 [Cydia pomonella]|uniref:uncharacterized protein LOC133515513 n=1 Tax=Cydia pomonella TaxID=82600 RepID=UPI002ADE021F|nr:uncharacterized protein LOC133515513 [Cydia pomonella]
MIANEKETRLQIANPCKHIFVKPIFESLFNLTKKCQIEKVFFFNLASNYFDYWSKHGFYLEHKISFNWLESDQDKGWAIKIAVYLSSSNSIYDIQSELWHWFPIKCLNSHFPLIYYDFIFQGLYQNEVDVGGYITNYFGGSFFYGNVTFKSSFYSDECNFSCTSIGVELTPKK